MDSVLVFDIFGDYAQFKKFFTNMSPLTFDIPSRTALAGIIGAIGGVPKEENPEFFSRKSCFLSLQVLRYLNKTKIPMNYLKTISKTEISRYKNHKPTNIEFIKKPRYRVFFHHWDADFFVHICSMIREHKAVYTPCLGIAGCLADFTYVGVWKILPENPEGFTEISSIVPEELLEDIMFQTDVKIKRATIPLEMKNDREVIVYGSMLYETSGKKMMLKVKNSFLLPENGDHICEF